MSEEPPVKKLPMLATVQIFDDEQPITNPKPYWLEIARFNEPTDAHEFALDYLRRYSYARLRVIVNGKPWAPRSSTPAAEWMEAGEPDPHGTRYDCPRERLACGHLTDDQLANAFYMITAPPMTLAARMEFVKLQTAVKDRLRWLSRRLTK